MYVILSWPDFSVPVSGYKSLPICVSDLHTLKISELVPFYVKIYSKRSGPMHGSYFGESHTEACQVVSLEISGARECPHSGKRDEKEEIQKQGITSSGTFSKTMAIWRHAASLHRRGILGKYLHILFFFLTHFLKHCFSRLTPIP